MHVEVLEVHAEMQGTVLLPDQDDHVTPWGLAQMNHSCFWNISQREACTSSRRGGGIR